MSFWKRTIFIDEIFQITMIAEFRDDIRVVGSLENVKQLQTIDVWIHLVEDVYLVFEEKTLDFIRDTLHVDDFYRHNLISWIVLTPKNLTGIPLPD